MTRRRAFLAAAPAALLALAACDRILPSSGPVFNGTDITGAELGPEFRLTDHNGKPRTLADFRGKVVVLFFGYTQCPDVCPTTLSDMAHAMQALGPDAARVQVLFVTVDPKRDTPELLRNYVPAFNPDFLGLYGDEEATKKVAKDFRIYYGIRPGKTPETYTVDHSAQTLVFDPKGRIRLLIQYGTPSDKIAADLKLLLNS
jgi:protein SCO1/2